MEVKRKTETRLKKAIEKLKKERKALILAHNYQLGEVQDIADFVGDSLELSIKASQTQARIIVFCGVRFMAETASILCPDKKVLLPDPNAGCPLADMITPEALRKLKENHPGAKIISYVNSSAGVKAESDICCTSANAVKIVNSLRDGKIIFVPDMWLGDWVQKRTGKNLILWHGFCPTHVRILPQHILDLKEEHPEAKVMVHPECRAEVISLADRVTSTGGMIRYAREEKSKSFIVGTEIGIVHRLRKENPGKRFYPASEQGVCPNMKLISLEKVLWALEELNYEVKVSPEIARKARRAIEIMLQIR